MTDSDGNLFPSRERDANYETSYDTFEQIEHTFYEFGQDVNPEENYFNKLDQTNNCKYYTENENLKVDGDFSLINVNSRSLNKNFNEISEYVCPNSANTVWLQFQSRGYAKRKSLM